MQKRKKKSTVDVDDSQLKMNKPCLNNEHCNRNSADNGQPNVVDGNAALSGESVDTGVANTVQNHVVEHSATSRYKVV